MGNRRKKLDKNRIRGDDKIRELEHENRELKKQLLEKEVSLQILKSDALCFKYSLESLLATFDIKIDSAYAYAEKQPEEADGKVVTLFDFVEKEAEFDENIGQGDIDAVTDLEISSIKDEIEAVSAEIIDSKVKKDRKIIEDKKSVVDLSEGWLKSAAFAFFGH